RGDPPPPPFLPPRLPRELTCLLFARQPDVRFAHGKTLLDQVISTSPPRGTSRRSRRSPRPNGRDVHSGSMCTPGAAPASIFGPTSTPGSVNFARSLATMAHEVPFGVGVGQVRRAAGARSLDVAARVPPGVVVGVPRIRGQYGKRREHRGDAVIDGAAGRLVGGRSVALRPVRSATQLDDVEGRGGDEPD